MYSHSMKFASSTHNWRLLQPVVIFLLTGCVSTPLQPIDETFTGRLQKTLSAGITQISEKYIEHISLSNLALEGLRGLDNIDSDLIIQVGTETLVVYSRGLSRLEYFLPAENNADSWSSLMAVSLQSMRTGDTPISKASEEKLFEAIFDGSMSLLDPFSRYAGTKNASKNRAERSGSGGIGVEIAYEDKGARILVVYPATPAAAAGLQANDLITHANSAALTGLRPSKILKTIRGNIGSFVDLIVERDGGRPLNLSIRRARILRPTVQLVRKKGILQAAVTGFNNETSRQLATRIQSAFKNTPAPVEGMVLDLRGNPGGVMTQAIMLADLFLVSGKILTTRGRHPSSRHEYIARGNDILNNLPLVVLINGKSASASEIVAAALQDQQRAIIVGSASFGKGSVQSVSRLPNGGELKLTWSQFITPSGYILHGLGVPPAICLRGDEETADEAIARSLEKISVLQDVMSSWQEVEVSDKEARRSLRATCPSNAQNRALDVEVAEKLIRDPELYRRIIRISPSIASANN